MNRSSRFLILLNVALLGILLLTTADDPGDSDSGHWLAMYQAEQNRDLTSATLYKMKRAALNPTLPHLEEAFYSALLAGDFESAERLVDTIRSDSFLWYQLQEQLARDASSVKSFIAIFAMVSDIKKRRWNDAKTILNQLNQSPRLSSNFERRLHTWFLMAKGETEDALLLVRQDGNDGIRILTEALISDFFHRDTISTKRLYANAFQRLPDDFVTSLLYANFLMRQHLWDDAARVFRHIGKSDELYFLARQGLHWTDSEYQPAPTMTSPTFGLALSLYNNAFNSEPESDQPFNFLKSLAWTRLASYSDPSFMPAYFVTYMLLNNSAYTRESISALRQLNQNPLWTVFTIYITVTLLEQNQLFKDAEDFLRLALTQFPDDRFLNDKLGDLLLNLEEYPEALMAYDQALADRDSYDTLGSQDPSREKHILADFYYGRAIALHHINRLQESEEALKVSLEYKKDDPFVLNYLAYSLIEQDKNLDEALAMLEKARSLEPDNGSIIDSYGWGLYKMGKFREAVTFLEEAARLLPGDPVINDHLGDALWMNDRPLEAVYHWQRALNRLVRENKDKKLRTTIQKKLDDPHHRPRLFKTDTIAHPLE